MKIAKGKEFVMMTKDQMQDAGFSSSDMRKMKYYAHLFSWGGDEDVVEIDKQDIDDIVIAVERQAYVRVGNRIINGSLYRTVDILEADIGTTDK